MILVDQKPLELDALNDKTHKLHDFAKEYDDTIKELRAKYKNGFIRFNKVGYPRYTKGADSNFRELPKVMEPPVQMRIPLKAYATTGKLGKHLWMCCLDTPTVLPNGLWDMGRKKSMKIETDVLVNIETEPDLAFFLYRISPFVKRGLLKIVDPVADDEQLGEEERMLAMRKSAVWSQLTDEKLKIMARAYGIAAVDEKQPNGIRKELEALLERNDSEQKRNPIIKGTKEFIEELKVTDGLLLRNFVQRAMDERMLVYKDDGRWRIGEKVVIQVPQSELKRKNDYLCNYLMAGNNAEKLQEFLRDLINKDYLDGIPDTKDGNKEWAWLAKVAGVSLNFTKFAEVKSNVSKFFCPLE